LASDNQLGSMHTSSELFNLLMVLALEIQIGTEMDQSRKVFIKDEL
jgi:hypothetical protein